MDGNTARAWFSGLVAGAKALPVIAVLLFSLSRLQGVPSDGLLFLAQSESETLRSGEPVAIRLMLLSRGHAVVWVPTLLLEGANLSLEVLDPSGERVSYLGPKSTLKPLDRGHVIRLRPEYFYGKRVVLSDYFAMKKTGTYRVRVEFRNEDSGKGRELDVWTGRLASNEIRIEIRE